MLAMTLEIRYVQSTLIGNPIKNEKSKRVPPCKINCRNPAHYLDVPGIYTCKY